MLHFYWLVSNRRSYQQTHCVIMLYHRLFGCMTVTMAVFEPLSLYDHRLGAMITEIAMIILQCQYFREAEKRAVCLGLKAHLLVLWSLKK